MTIKTYRITTAILALLCVVLGVSLFLVKFRADRFRMDVRYSRDFANGIKTDCDFALKRSVQECIYSLQKHQLSHDSIEIVLADYVEEERKRCVKDVINHLRNLTGKDFSDAPEGWIKRTEQITSA